MATETKIAFLAVALTTLVWVQVFGGFILGRTERKEKTNGKA